MRCPPIVDRVPNSALLGGADGSYRGNSSSAQAASHNVLTVTRMRLRAVGTGGQKKKLPVPSSPGKPRQSPGTPVCSFPASSVARTRKHGVIMGQYSPITHGGLHRTILRYTLTDPPGDHHQRALGG